MYFLQITLKKLDIILIKYYIVMFRPFGLIRQLNGTHQSLAPADEVCFAHCLSSPPAHPFLPSCLQWLCHARQGGTANDGLLPGEPRLFRWEITIRGQSMDTLKRSQHIPAPRAALFAP